jgi:hypothetical protein
MAMKGREMIESGCGVAFALEAAKRLGIFGEVVGEKFESDKAVETSVLGFVDDSHAPATKFFDDAVVGDRLADHLEHRGLRHRMTWRERVNFAPEVEKLKPGC